jgi:hypothetical protein
MNSSSGLRKIGWGVLVATLLLCGGSSSAQVLVQTRTVQTLPGTPVDGLQLAVSFDASARSANVPAFRVGLRNVGKKDLLLDLGTVSSNGRQYPTAVSLTLEDAQGGSQRLLLKTFSAPNSLGAKPLLLPLPAGATFSFPVDLRNYWVLGNKEFSAKLKPGTYSLEAQYAGLGSGHPMPTAAELPPQPKPGRSFDNVNSSVTSVPTSNELHFRVTLP